MIVTTEVDRHTGTSNRWEESLAARVRVATWLPQRDQPSRRAFLRDATSTRAERARMVERMRARFG